MNPCSKGWDIRCAHARSKKCNCACGGEHHGKYRKSLLLPLGINMKANYQFVGMGADGSVTILDIGPWDKYSTVTNAAESVVKEILGKYPQTKRIFYYDSDGQKDELKIKDGKFDGFAPGPERKK